MSWVGWVGLLGVLYLAKCKEAVLRPGPQAEGHLFW
jgi:hypothetical protein